MGYIYPPLTPNMAILNEEIDQTRPVIFHSGEEPASFRSSPNTNSALPYLPWRIRL